jgi:hypothetical protein
MVIRTIEGRFGAEQAGVNSAAAVPTSVAMSAAAPEFRRGVAPRGGDHRLPVRRRKDSVQK